MAAPNAVTSASNTGNNQTSRIALAGGKAKFPNRIKAKIYWAPRNVLLAYFEHVLQQPESRDLAYVMALLLIQKKILVIHDDGETTDQIQVRNRLDKTEYQLPVCELPPDRMAEIQEILGEQLFVDQPLGDDDVDADQEPSG